eukprot:1196893-Rhodomonas_salina.1
MGQGVSMSARVSTCQHSSAHVKRASSKHTSARIKHASAHASARALCQRTCTPARALRRAVEVRDDGCQLHPPCTSALRQNIIYSSPETSSASAFAPGTSAKKRDMRAVNVLVAAGNGSVAAAKKKKKKKKKARFTQEKKKGCRPARRQSSR